MRRLLMSVFRLCALAPPVLLLAQQQAQDPLQFDFDLRNRFVVRDNEPVYRSIVNLGNGPRLFGGHLRYTAGKDILDVSTSSLGDPNSDARLQVRRKQVYEAIFHYRALAYFNNLPSFANPLLAQGVASSQRAIDMRRRQFDFDLRLRPGARLVPFFNLLRTSGGGSGITPFVGSGDEFPVPTTFHDALTTARGGVDWRLPGDRWRGTAEQGWTGYTDEQNLDSGASGPNGGNRGSDTLILNHLVERYRGSGSGWFTRGVVQAEPWRSLSFTGHFIYSRPKLDQDHTLQADGVFRDPATLRTYTNLVEQSFSDASQPRTSGSWSTEYRPFARWRFRHNWFSDAYRISGGSASAANLLGPSLEATSLLHLRYDQSETEVFGELTRFLTVRAGHRYVRSDADLPPASLTFPETPTTSRIRRQTALAGVSLNPWKGRLQANVDYEQSPGGQTYFRTGLLDYRKLSLQSRFRISDSLRITASHRNLVNNNMGNDLASRQTSVNAEWLPSQGRRVTMVGGYTREFIRSLATYAAPQDLQTVISRYDDRLHHVNGYADIRLPRGVQLHAGGSVSRSDGTRPTRYYSPQTRILIPAGLTGLSAVGEWRWYHYQSFDAFRAHTVSVGVQYRLRQ